VKQTSFAIASELALRHSVAVNYMRPEASFLLKKKKKRRAVGPGWMIFYRSLFA
jgi:hypothetical protein